MTDWFLIGVKIYIMVIVVGAVVVPVIFYSVGFTPAIALSALSRFRRPPRSVLLIIITSEGSLAATWHGYIGNVVAGSAFAILQSLGAAPWSLAVVGGATCAFGCLIHSLWKNTWDEDSSEKA